LDGKQQQPNTDLVVSVRFVVKAGTETLFLARVLRQAKESLDLEAGCLTFDVCVDPSNPGRVFLYEVYADAGAFDLHRNSAHFRAFDADTREWIAEKVVHRWTRAHVS
jgi:quinol monooxygenase YgiN